ncbi:MAG: superoxide dismutase, Ni [bacterium]|nr:superoxide dismutase, Ni [bacterium]MDZ4231195.1 superoxide dismutase, Ni [Patescibacteria group bacterium]
MRFWKIQIAHAHCDIPCGIYDPHAALIAALTMLRMMDLLGKTKDAHEIARLTAVKEEHGEACKREIRVIWGDYFKEEHFKQHPEIHDLVHEIMQLSSKGRQGANRKDGEALLEAVNRFAEIFWETKGIKTKRVKAPQSIEEEVVVPEL